MGSLQIPKYIMLENVLRERVRQLTPGDRLPSESDLAREFGVSRVTLQRALRPLVEDGVISRQQGKGTFFVGQDEPKTLQILSGALDSLMVYESGAQARVIEKTRWAQASPEVRRHLGLDASDGVVIIKRVAVSDGDPLIYIVNFLPVELGEKVYNDDRELEQFPIISLLRDKYKIPLIRASQTIEAVLADPTIAQHLAISVGSPLLLVERTYFAEDGQAAQFTQSWYRSDRYKYAVTLHDWSRPRWTPSESRKKSQKVRARRQDNA